MGEILALGKVAIELRLLIRRKDKGSRELKEVLNEKVLSVQSADCVLFTLDSFKL